MNANSYMVGGSHYKKEGAPDHWDLAIMYGWDPFQYQITKYVMRWKDKHATREKRLEDLKKAQHFLTKYLENYESYDREDKSPDDLHQIHSDDEWQNEGYYGDLTQLYRCRSCRTLVRCSGLEEARQTHGSCPNGTYTNQG